MNAKLPAAQLLELRSVLETRAEAPVPLRAELVAVEEDGMLRVRTDGGVELRCEWLDTGGAVALEAGDRLLVLPPEGDEPAVALGRVGRYRRPEPEAPRADVVIEAAETLTLKCGAASVDLRKDGKVMVRGDDVLLRAKKTQRIKAGTVAIN